MNSNVIEISISETDSITYNQNTTINQYPPNIVFCGVPTEIVDVTNPATGKTWMDRNLGASAIATSSNDVSAYGALYQWGRGADGHQCRDSQTTSTLSSTDMPGHGEFIITDSAPSDWRAPQNNILWQGVGGINNPCPVGYRLPTEAELDEERLSWSQNNAIGAFSSPLKLPAAGVRFQNNGSLSFEGSSGSYWSSTISSAGTSINVRVLNFTDSTLGSDSSISNENRAKGYCIRCIKD